MAELFIAGEFTQSDGERRTVANPAGGEPIDTVPDATPADIEGAVAAAAEAFATWSEVRASRRGELLHRAAREVRAHRGELARLLTSEHGKTLREAGLEIHRFAITLEHYAGLARDLRGSHVPDLDHNTYGLVVRRPIGVVAAVVAWNFPALLLANKIGPAVVAGNAVVAKPSETTPLTTLRIAELMENAGLPAGVLNIICGGPEVGEALVRHPGVRKVAFTGTTATGEKVAAAAAAGLKRLTLELSGSDPFIVCEDADVDAAASAASVGRFFNAGQSCLAVKRVYCAEPVADAFLERLVQRAERLTVGPPTMDGTILGPLHSEAIGERLEAQLKGGVESGGAVVTGGSRAEGDGTDAGWYFDPTVVLDPAHDSPLATEEVLGPVLPVWRVGDLAEAIDRANASPFGLGSSIWTRDLNIASLAAEELEAGYTWINAPQRLYDELPLGGVGASGFGKEHGHEALEEFTESKSVVVRHSAAGARRS
ncbi:MAG TPA: aldehyde dehydrogenase family protein [Solirubrobacteraceae bacterium]|nr:aldehyde dehydrogenase family protein [Solirubrobacteraceae bacterium]